MTSDLAARLRAVTANSLICREAADELERLRAALEKIARDEKAAHQAWVSRSEETARDALRGADEIHPREGDNRAVSTERRRNAAAVSGTPESYSRSDPCQDARTPAGDGAASPVLHTHETPAVPGPQLCTCRDGARYRFIRQGEDELPTEHEAAFAAMWADITLKGYWREHMDKRIDEAMQQLNEEVVR